MWVNKSKKIPVWASMSLDEPRYGIFFFARAQKKDSCLSLDRPRAGHDIFVRVGIQKCIDERRCSILANPSMSLESPQWASKKPRCHQQASKCIPWRMDGEEDLHLGMFNVTGKLLSQSVQATLWQNCKQLKLHIYFKVKLGFAAESFAVPLAQSTSNIWSNVLHFCLAKWPSNQENHGVQNKAQLWKAFAHIFFRFYQRQNSQNVLEAIFQKGSL